MLVSKAVSVSDTASVGRQKTDLQFDALVEAGVDPANIYEDMASGRKDGRPDLAACLKALRPHDTLVVWKLDRLGRSLKHLVESIEEAFGLWRYRLVCRPSGNSSRRQHNVHLSLPKLG